jgi:hypothetical protein
MASTSYSGYRKSSTVAERLKRDERQAVARESAGG